jgi:hypothetical protein
MMSWLSLKKRLCSYTLKENKCHSISYFSTRLIRCGFIILLPSTKELNQITVRTPKTKFLYLMLTFQVAYTILHLSGDAWLKTTAARLYVGGIRHYINYLRIYRLFRVKFTSFILSINIERKRTKRFSGLQYVEEKKYYKEQKLWFI